MNKCYLEIQVKNDNNPGTKWKTIESIRLYGDHGERGNFTWETDPRKLTRGFLKHYMKVRFVRVTKEVIRYAERVL
jgi:hypothetical protein